jgi:hypothetical protein
MMLNDFQPLGNPNQVSIWKGKVDGEFLAGLKDAYARRILKLGAVAPAEVPGGSWWKENHLKILHKIFFGLALLFV